MELQSSKRTINTHTQKKKLKEVSLKNTLVLQTIKKKIPILLDDLSLSQYETRQILKPTYYKISRKLLQLASFWLDEWVRTEQCVSFWYYVDNLTHSRAELDNIDEFH